MDKLLFTQAPWTSCILFPRRKVLDTVMRLVVRNTAMLLLWHRSAWIQSIGQKQGYDWVRTVQQYFSEGWPNSAVIIMPSILSFTARFFRPVAASLAGLWQRWNVSSGNAHFILPGHRITQSSLKIIPGNNGKSRSLVPSKWSRSVSVDGKYIFKPNTKMDVRGWSKQTRDSSVTADEEITHISMSPDCAVIAKRVKSIFLPTLGPCCNIDYRQGPENLSNRKPWITMRWYLVCTTNSKWHNRSGKEYCWSESVLEDGV